LRCGNSRANFAASTDSTSESDIHTLNHTTTLCKGYFGTGPNHREVPEVGFWGSRGSRLRCIAAGPGLTGNMTNFDLSGFAAPQSVVDVVEQEAEAVASRNQQQRLCNQKEIASLE
jgi:hypothetical protein